MPEYAHDRVSIIMAPGMVSLSDQHYEPFAPVGAQNLSHGSEMCTVSLASDIVLSRAHVIIESLDPILCTEDSTSGRILQGGFRKVAPRPNVVPKKESRSVMVFATRFGKKIIAFSNSIASSLSSAQAIDNPI